MKDSNTVYLARLHWVIFFWPLILFSFGLYLYFAIAQLAEVGIFCILFAFAWAIMTWFTYQFSAVVIKKTQIILRTGFWIKKTIDIPFSKIESIDIRRNILGSILHYGTLVITGTGGSRQMINYLYRPLTCRRYIEQLMVELN